MRLVYIAGPYRGPDITAVRKNIQAAKNTAIDLIARQVQKNSLVWFPVIPHMNTALFDFQGELEGVPDEYYLQGTMQQMQGCQAVVLVSHDAILKSVGTTEEVARANARGIPVFVNVESFIRFVTDRDYHLEVQKQTASTFELCKSGAFDELVTFGV